MDMIDHVPTDEEKLARAKENGFVEAEPLSREERAHALVATMEHAVRHNAPVTLEMLREMRELLEVPPASDVPASQVEG